MTDTIIVGAGICGLQLAALLASDGQEVLVLEKQSRPGGRAYIWEKDGFKVDNGVHLVRFGPKKRHRQGVQKNRRAPRLQTARKKLRGLPRRQGMRLPDIAWRVPDNENDDHRREAQDPGHHDQAPLPGPERSVRDERQGLDGRTGPVRRLSAITSTWSVPACRSAPLSSGPASARCSRT